MVIMADELITLDKAKSIKRIIDDLSGLIEASKFAEKELLWGADQFEGGAPLISAARALRAALDKIEGK